MQKNLAVFRQMVADQRRHADAEVDVRALGDVERDALRDLVAGEFRVAHRPVAVALPEIPRVTLPAEVQLRSLRGTLTTRVTKIPGVTMHSGSSAPSSTISYTWAMVHFAALAMVGPKLRALLR